MKKIEVGKTYKCRFKDGTGEAFFIHLQSRLVDGQQEDTRVKCKRKMGTVYQMLTLYDSIRNGDAHAHGTFLAYINELDDSVLNKIDWTEWPEWPEI